MSDFFTVTSSASDQSLVTYYGGTFDPIHNGHLNICRALSLELPITNIRLLPNNIPPHRPQPVASSFQRLAMLKLAIENDGLFSIDDRELRKQHDSYTIETLIDLRNELSSQQSLGFIVGQDSIETIMHWHRWEELLEYTHLIVCPRQVAASLSSPLESNTTINAQLDLTTGTQSLATQNHRFVLEDWLNTQAIQNKPFADWIRSKLTTDPKALISATRGLIYFAHTPYWDISASELRAYFANHLNYDQLTDSVKYRIQNVIPQAVMHYILDNSLYS